MRSPPKDLPWDELIQQANDALAKGTVMVWFKFTCCKCGERQTFEEPNALFTEGKCEECGAITSLKENGGGFMVLLKLR